MQSIQSFLIITVFMTIAQLNPTQSANILFFFGVSTYSHRITVWNLVETLAERGHNITFFQPFHPKRKNPKVKEFFPKEIEEAINESDAWFRESLLNIRLKEGRIGTQLLAAQLPFEGENICRKLLSRQVTIDWANNAQFDLVIIDALFNECGLGFAYKFNAKVILFGTTSLFSWFHEPFGIPAETSWLPELHVSFQYPMSFSERLLSTMIPLGMTWYKEWIYYPKLEELLRTKLDMPNMPMIKEMERNVSLMLLNTHFSEEFARSFPPFIVPVGGVHLTKKSSKQEIPKDMAKFMDESGDEGFILVSFGSAAQISDAPPEFRNIFYTAFKNSPTRFIWKWEGERPAEMPANIFTSEWLPQAEILGHPKIKAFMTHGGLMSIQESITFAVPLIVFPIFAEQDYNAFRVERMGRGIRLEISTLTIGQLQTAIKQVLKNPMFKNNMLETLKLFEDRPSPPIETAIWWTEYVLRHTDTSHLKPLSMHQRWYERRLLDVWSFMGVVFLIACLILIYVTKKLLICFFSKKVDSSKVSKVSRSNNNYNYNSEFKNK